MDPVTMLIPSMVGGDGGSLIKMALDEVMSQRNREEEKKKAEAKVRMEMENNAGNANSHAGFQKVKRNKIMTSPGV